MLALQEVLRQRDAELSLLRDTVRHRDENAEHLAGRLDAATRDYAVAHEDSRQLREKVRQIEDALAAERAEHAAMLGELRGESAVVERESARLALEQLRRENEELRRREAESALVVGRLMADVEAGHRGGVVRPLPTVSYTHEEHEADVEKQLRLLRAELEETFGEDISRMKEQMRDHYSTTVDQLRRDLERSDEERTRAVGQVSLWQQQYLVLSQQGVSSVEITQKLNDAVADNVRQRQHIADLTAQVEQLNAQLSSSSQLPRLSSRSVGVETSSELEAYGTENLGEETGVLHARIDELRTLLNDACEDHDRSIARSRAVEQELEAARRELVSARSQHAGELQKLEAKAASDFAELTTQLKTVELASIEAKSMHDGLERALYEKQSQFEAVQKDCEHRIEQLMAENAYAMESQHVKMNAAIDEYKSREQKSVTLIEELQMKYELAKKENSAIAEQLQHHKTLKTDIPSAASAAVMGASDVDSVVADLSFQLEKVTRERDSAMQSLQTIYGDRIELQQTIRTLESERNSLTTQVNHLDEQLAQTRGQLSRLKHSPISRSTASLSSVGTGSIPNMPSVTDAADRPGPDVIDSLRAEFEELQRLRREKDLSSSFYADSTVRVRTHSEADASVSQTADVSTGEVEEVLDAKEIATMKQEYSVLCAELVRLREMLITLQRVDREREQVRSQFELEIRLLRDELLRRDHVDTASLTGTVKAALDDELQERDAEIDSLKGRLAMTLSRMEEVIDEKDQQCASYENELEEVREEHSSALRRIDALVQEHNILLGGQVPLSSVAPENVREMPVVIHSEIMESVDEDVSPKRIAYDNQAKEIEHLRDQLHQAAREIETLTLDRDRLNEALESNATELLARLEKAASENAEQQQIYEKKIVAYVQDIEQLSRKVDTVTAELERSNAAHMSEMAKVRDDCQTQFNELSFSNDESNREHHQELCAAQKQCTELQTQLEKLTAEKASMEQEYVTVMHDINKENSARISALHEDFEQDLARVRLESEKAYGNHAVQLEEELNQSRQEIAQLKQSLELSESNTRQSDKHKSEDEDLDILQVLQLRINDLTETKDELQQRLDVATSKNEQLCSEVEALLSEKENLRRQVASLPPDYPHGVGSVDTESAADTSGDSHVFYTPTTSRKTVVEKLKSVQSEKELLTNMVERLNAEKEQLKSHLVTRHQPTQVFEADIRHLELSPSDTEVCRMENVAELRIKQLESEKELLAGMLVKLSCEKERLVAETTFGADNVLDVSYDDGLSSQLDTSVEKSVTFEACEEPELTEDEVIALRNNNASLRAKVSNLERQISSGLQVASVDPQETSECTTTDDLAGTLVFDSSEHEQSREDLSANAEEVESCRALMETVRTLEERLSIVAMERDRLTGDLAQVVQECVELKAGRADLTESTKHSIEALRNELDSCKADRESLARKQAATDSQLAEVNAERDELCGKIGALEDALKSAVEEKDHRVQSRALDVVAVPANMEHGDAQKPDEASVDENELTEKNSWLESRVKELEVVRVTLLNEKEAVAEQYSKTVDELKTRLLRMQATVESLQSEEGVRSQDLAELQSKCEKKQRIIDEIMSRLHLITPNKIDDIGDAGDDETSMETSLVGKVDFLQSEIIRLHQEPEQPSSDLAVAESKKAGDLLPGEGGILANESQTSGLAAEETGTDFADTGASEPQQMGVALRQTSVPTGEQSTMTEESAFSGTYSSDVPIKLDVTGTAYSDEDASALQRRLEMLKAALEAVTEERDQFAARFSELKHSSPKAGIFVLMSPGKPDVIDSIDLAVMETDSGAASEVVNADFAQHSSEETAIVLEHGQAESDKATDHKEMYLHLDSRQCIALSDDSIDVQNITGESTVSETFDAAVEANISAAQNADCSLLVKIDELMVEMCALKEERDEVRQKLLLAQSSVQETQGNANDKIRALEDELAAVCKELNGFKTRCSEQQETAQTLLVKNQKLVAELHAVTIECERLSAQLESAQRDLQQLSADTSSDVASGLETLTTELKNATRENSELTAKLADADKTFAELHSEMETTLEERNAVAVQLHDADAERMELKKSVVDQQKALADLESLQKEGRRLSEENNCLVERCDAAESARRAVESQLNDLEQRTSSLQTENHELAQTNDLLLSDNSSLKQLISEYADKVNSLTASEQLALENWTRAEEQLLAKIEGLETDLSAMVVENSTLKSEVNRIPVLTEEIASTSVERDDAQKRCTELEAEVIKLRKDVEAINSKFDVTSLELTETRAELARCCEEAECEIGRLKKLAEEKTSCVLDLQSALSRTQEELAVSQKERENLCNAFALERNAFEEQAAANEAAMSEFKSRLAVAVMASCQSEEIEKELALKREELKAAEGRLVQQQSVQDRIESDNEVRIEDLESECENLRTTVNSCRMDADTARESLSQMEGLCRALTAERDELAKENSTLLADSDAVSRKLVLLEQQLEQVGTDTIVREIEAVRSVDTAQPDAKLAATDIDVGQEDQNFDASRHEDQIAGRNVDVLAVELELKSARESVQLPREVDGSQHEYQQLKWTADDSLDLQEPDEFQLDTPRRLQQELAGQGSSRSTEGGEEWQTRLHELDALTEVSTSAGEYSVHASRTFTKLDVEAAETSTGLTDERDIPLVTEAKTSPGAPPESSTSLADPVCASGTFTRLVSTDTAACQTELITGQSEIDVGDLYSQINSLQLALEQQKLSHDQLTEKLQTDCTELAKARDVLLQENSSLTEELNEKVVAVDASSMTDCEASQSHVRAEIEAEVRRHYESEMEARDTEHREELRAVNEECDRQVSAAENCARTQILESSPSETFVAESVLSTDCDSAAGISDVISQRDQLKSDLADKLKELAELRGEIDELREENQRQMMSALPGTLLDLPESADVDGGHPRLVANLESQLLMSTEENERLQQKIDELEQQAAKLNAARKDMEEQHATEMKVLEFSMEESFQKRQSNARADIEAEFKETYRKRKEALDAEFKRKSENFRRETELKFLLEFKKVCAVIKIF